MSIQALNLIMRTHIGDGVAKLVAIVLADYADPTTGEAWPKVESLAERCSQAPRTVQRKLKELAGLGIIAIEPQYRGRKQVANKYRILGVGDDPRRTGRGDRIDAGEPAPATGDTQSPLPENEAAGVTDGHPRGDGPDTPGVTLLSPLENPPFESTRGISSPQPPEGGRRAPKVFRGNGIERPVAPCRLRDVQPPLEGDVAGRFEALWAGAPEGSRIAADRIRAQREFAQLSAEDQQLAVGVMRSYRAHVERDQARAMALHTWLRKRRFMNLKPSAPKAASPAAGAVSRVFVRVDTPAWEAWADHDRAAGRVPKPATWSNQQRAEGWWFPSEFPGQAARAA
ncbi:MULTISPECIES: helix-turn-helix domain-containing protein [Methylobacterium]|uniref:Helix-turn-helix domain-containing protein n=3 Tax=Pseudomonadota TaxID=1224 RepID=A0ABQ4SXA6_9HYPH|nr:MULTISPECIES: helix-turn-helix domain-containing protein [Methylobacterium]PIU08186.1 MAG: hypothetical protein COT56_02365 [Methylobacterium sp. CG09_land_8_20_14_0_10_71_15]PIU15696.1 MAG: hypothetical protein COT28_03615 [Methylobacterium sp. CG08_land_8_20_14_0_20_71_15]GBU17242.1 hypothetical protein AwMethylo_14570 [Methylobacterium sp.]GJE07844.1 hypothetical protein AOPFMNJM_3176 [Methylobacterium jeotgali]